VSESLIFVIAFAALLSPFDPSLIWLSFFLAELATWVLLYGLGRRLKKREHAEGLLLLSPEEGEPGARRDITIPATQAHAVGLSEQIIRFCLDNGADRLEANRMGVAAEEMALNTAIHSKGAAHLDVLIHAAPNRLLLRLRDDGPPFDPTTYAVGESERTGFITEGIELVKRLATDISYTRQLGFNTVIVSVERSH
jgi:anti-sigma regulatory factor (Ser/Thr protein kinase)